MSGRAIPPSSIRYSSPTCSAPRRLVSTATPTFSYRQIDTLREYLAVDLVTRRLELYRRLEGGRWLLIDLVAGDEVELTSLALRQRVDDLLAAAEYSPTTS